MENKKDCMRHGDIIIKPTTEKVQGEKQNHLILAEGEATGHYHKIVEGTAELFKYNDKMYLKVISDIAKIDHQEHGLRALTKGDYEIDIQQEWKEDGWTKVID